jgi:hypothetical protein
MICSGAPASRPGWIWRVAPVACCAREAARSVFSSHGSAGQLIPISPMMPERTPVSPTPTWTSRTISSSIASSGASS